MIKYRNKDIFYIRTLNKFNLIFVANAIFHKSMLFVAVRIFNLKKLRNIYLDFRACALSPYI